MRSSLLALPLLLAISPARAQEAELRAAIGEIDRLRLAGRLGDARQRLADSTKIDLQAAPAELRTRMVMAQDALLATAADAYLRGEECGFFTQDERAQDPGLRGPPSVPGRQLLRDLLRRLERVPRGPARAAYLNDPAYARLRAAPATRASFFMLWGRPAQEVWKEPKLVTGDAEADALIARHTREPVDDPQVVAAPITAWIDAKQPTMRAAGDAWPFIWRCALMCPHQKGAGPARSGLLQDPKAVAEARRAILARAGAEPKGFDALCLLNLAVAGGEGAEQVRALVLRLQAEGGPFYDLALFSAHALALRLKDVAAPGLVDLLDQHALGVAPAPGQDPLAELRAGLAELLRLSKAGKHAEARARLDANRALTKGQALPRELALDLLVADGVVFTAAARAYGRGEDCGFYTPKDLTAPHLAGKPPRILGVKLQVESDNRLLRTEAADLRARVLDDPLLDELRDTPCWRYQAWAWGRAPRLVWPDVKVATRDARFDAVFEAIADKSTRPGAPLHAPVHGFLAERDPQRRPLPDEWVFRYQCALLLPHDHGGWAHRVAFLDDPAQVRQVLDVLRPRLGDAPQGFDALCQLNLEIAAGGHERAKALLVTLQREGGFLYDVAIEQANCMAQAVRRRADRPEVRALIDLIAEHSAGLPEPIPGFTPRPRPRPAAPPPTTAIRQRVTEGLADVARKREAGDLRGARAALDALAPQTKGDLPVDLLAALSVAEDAVDIAGAQAYVRGEDCGVLSKERLEAAGLAGKPLRARGVALLLDVAQGWSRGRPTVEIRTALLADPSVAWFRETPLARTSRWSKWLQAPREIWKGLRLRTGDAGFDRMFEQLADQPVPEMGNVFQGTHDWMRATERTARTPAEVWRFRWRCALAVPHGEGGWPTRLSMLQDPRAVDDAIATIRRDAGAAPKGFDALCLVNLELSAGNLDEVEPLLAALEGEGGGLLHDVGVEKAYTHTGNVLQWPGRDTPELRELRQRLLERLLGLTPKASATR